jgi:hypothetical protein
MLNTIDEILVAVDTYLFTRAPGETAEKSDVRNVLSGLYRFQRLADGFQRLADGLPIISEGEPDFRRAVTAALTRDLDDPAEQDSIKVQIGDRLKAVPPDAASLSDLIHGMADKLRKAISAPSQAPLITAS